MFAKFKQRRGDGVVDSDNEFAVANDTFRVPKAYYSFVLQDKLMAETGVEDQLVLEAPAWLL